MNTDTPETDKERHEARARVEIITPNENNPVAEYFSSPNTPETDARAYKFNDEDGVHCEAVHADFARRLERERDEAREAIHIAESLIKPQIEREQVTPEAKPDNDKQRDMTALLRLLREVRRERDEARNELEDYKASTIHSCNEECKRPMCVLRRQRREAREDAEHWKTEYLIVAARLCGKKHPRDNGIISEHEIIPKLERERDEAREKAERYRLEANAMMLQRDELKKIVEQRILVGAEIHNKANAMDDYLANKQTNNHPLYGGDSLL